MPNKRIDADGKKRGGADAAITVARWLCGTLAKRTPMQKRPKYNFDSALEILNSIDSEQGDSSNTEDCGMLYDLIGSVTAESRSIVGIDIYKYSSFEFYKQSLIPFIFEMLYRETTNNCMKNEPWLFQHLSFDKFISAFIPTGDGGFQELRSPLHAIIFIIHFEANLYTHGGSNLYP